MASSSSDPISTTSVEPDSTDYELLESLKCILSNQTHLFACGGVIPFSSPDTPSISFGEGDQGNNTLAPITLRWDMPEFTSGHTNTGSRIDFPLEPGHEAHLNRLLQHCEKATFGLGGQDVLDETYRKAVQMDPTKFCTNFDPYSVGIIDTMAQVLLPTAVESTTHRAVRAELYKLNIYSGQNGKFKPHVDTPRSPFQFGSLVVCLPVEHTGGQLRVCHKKEEMTFDWSTRRDDQHGANIQWAAFYSDCQHEVLEVTSGHRLTLTYNLYAVQGAGRLTGVSRTLNPANLPLFQAMKNIPYQRLFHGKSGTLGFWCSHVYAYNNETETPLPETLKGLDSVLWESFKALGMQPRIAPVTRMTPKLREHFTDYYEEFDEEERASHCPWMRPVPPQIPSEYIIGRRFGIYVHDEGVEGAQVESIQEYHDMFLQWGDYSQGDIHWLSKPTASELQLVHSTQYGNNASLGTMYSGCAILVAIPAQKDSKE
ncbi:oxidoreductase, partial [Metarhizium majus ARSEF 297]